MDDETTVRATVTRMNDRYAVTVVLEKNGRSLTLAERTVNSRGEAETVARALEAHRGVPWHRSRCFIASPRPIQATGAQLC